MQHDNSGKNGVPIQGGMHHGCVRTFRQYSRSYHAKSFPLNEEYKDLVEEIFFGLNHPDGGTSAEMFVRWYDLTHNSDKPAARLEVFESAWDALFEFPDLFWKLKKLDSTRPQPDEIVKILLQCGFIDETQTTSP
jgi:hypothetical protein